MPAMTLHNQLSTCTMDANLGGCVYGCRHVLWGGAGTCEVAGQGDSVRDACSCDYGYTSKDSLGNPSCVLKTALLVMNMAVGSHARSPSRTSLGRWTMHEVRKLVDTR